MHNPIVELETAGGTFAVVDYGGSGPDCMLIHGTGQNAIAWKSCAERLADRFRVIAFDMRGHGQTLESSRDAAQYWKDIGFVADAIQLQKPLLVGHSTGAYAATAYVASGGKAAGLVCVDGFTLDSLGDARQAIQQANSDTTMQMLFEMFRYNWRATAAERDAYIEQVIADAPGDWLNDGIDPQLLRNMLHRCFIESDGLWLRRPTLEEIGIVSAPSAEGAIFPWRGLYDLVEIPMLLVWADRGLAADRPEDLYSIAAARPNRSLVALQGSHNLPMQRPSELADLITAGNLLAG
jgi:pimeloyl-ACP methyl ester carboxylesterase